MFISELFSELRARNSDMSSETPATGTQPVDRPPINHHAITYFHIHKIRVTRTYKEDGTEDNMCMHSCTGNYKSTAEQQPDIFGYGAGRVNE